MPELISFDRVAPLLDAIFEDVASMQVRALNLSAIDANATSLDAIQETMQVAASYNSLDGLINSKNAEILKSSATLQQSILSQYTSGLAQYQSSFDQVNAARSALNSLDPTSPDQSVKDKIKAANDNLNLLTQQQATLKTQLDGLKSQIQPLTMPPPTSSSPAVGTSASGASTTLKSSLLPQGFSAAPPAITSGAGTSNTNGPSLPPTKQMDTQIGLLWDRVMRLLSTLGQPDSRSGYRFTLLRFYPSVLYADKKTQGIQLTYHVSCDDGESPVILDVYPRIAPVNILDEKMRSRSWSLSAVVGFPGSNATANYNREHLRLTNMLGQSSFLTGFGAGTDTFGWTLGKTLGEDTISPGQRETYALAAIPKACGGKDKNGQELDNFNVSLLSRRWLSDGKVLQAVGSSLTRRFEHSTPEKLAGEREVAQINYSQTSTDKAPITFTFRSSIDPEARILVNGLVLKRSRDTFGRATPSTTPTPQTLFESTPDSLASGSWSRISERQITLLLDSGAYKDRLPLITMATPQRSTNISEGADYITFNGVNTYWPTATQALPGLLKPDTTALKTGKALRWQQEDVVSGHDHILISLDMDAPTTSTSASEATQTVTGSEIHAWGVAPIVVARGADVSGQLQVILDNCEAKGVMLDCQAWEPYEGSFQYRETPYTLTVYDTSHNATNTVIAQVYLHKSEAKKDRKPLFVSLPLPVFHADSKMWRFTYPVIWSNSPRRKLTTTLTTVADVPKTMSPPQIVCQSDNDCSMVFDVKVEQIYGITNDMRFGFELDGKPLSSSEISGLRSSLEPVLDSAPLGQQKELNGRNFVYSKPKLAFGLRGPTIPLDCPTEQHCVIPKYPKIDNEVNMYLLDAEHEDQPGEAAWHLITIGTDRKAWVYAPPKAVEPKAPVRSTSPAEKGSMPSTSEKQPEKTQDSHKNSTPTVKQ